MSKCTWQYETLAGICKWQRSWKIFAIQGWVWEYTIDLECEVENEIVEYVSIDKKLDDSDVNISINKDVHKFELHEIDLEKRRI